MASDRDGWFGELRVSYEQGALDESDLADTPLQQFDDWLNEAVAAGLAEPNAMVLATVAPDGTPAARNVLLKAVDERGFVFFTNLRSSKAVAIEHQPAVSLTFSWLEIHRQVCIRGLATTLARSEVQKYFESRPFGSQISAWVSRQSEPIASRADLEERAHELNQRFEEKVPVPDFWGGFVVNPVSIEFWQGRPSRLHDRLRYVAKVDSPSIARSVDWRIERLAP